MINRLYKITACLIVALGVLHMLFTARAYAEISTDALWFFGSGLAILFAGFLNLVLSRTGGKDRLTFGLCLVTDITMTLLFVAAFFLIPEPQVLTGALLFGFATGAAIMLGRTETSL